METVVAATGRPHVAAGARRETVVRRLLLRVVRLGGLADDRLLDRAGAEVIGSGLRDGGRALGTVRNMSRYVRDPDGNLLEFMIYS